MTRRNLTHIYFLLDRSGSMQSIKSDIERGFAAFVDKQRETTGTCQVTLAQFDGRYDVVYTGVPIAEVPPLVLQPRGSTALLDAMGKLITDAGAELAALPENDRPGTVVVAIITDGRENCSREWTHSAIKSLVEHQTAAYSWQFLYLGADQDAIEVGISLGVNGDYSATYDRRMTAEALTSMGDKVSNYRASRMTDPTATMAGYTAEERSSLAD